MTNTVMPIKLLDGRGDAFLTDNTEVLAWVLEIKDVKWELLRLVPRYYRANNKSETKSCLISSTEVAHEKRTKTRCA